MPLHIPNGHAELTPSWLTDALRASGLLMRGSVKQADVEVIGQEWGFTGVVARVRLQYNRAEGDAPHSLVAKLPNAVRESQSTYRESHNLSSAALQRHFERCAREIHFYHRIAPSGNVPVPRIYYGAADVEMGRFVLLLEDLAPARVGDALGGCSPGAAEGVLRQVALYHARWWNDPRLEAFGWLPRWSQNPATAQARLGAHIPPFLAKFRQRLSPLLRELIMALPESYAKVLTHLNGPPHTLIHADLHLDNIFFHPPDSARSVTIIDWQGVTRGRCAVDVGLFLAGSLDATERRRAELDLLHLYHSILMEGGVTDFTLDNLLLDYRLSLLWQLGGTINWLATADLDTLSGRERALIEAVLDPGLLFAALLDHDAAALLPL